MDAETSRLILRRPLLLDVPALFEFLGDAEAMQHTHVDASLRECRRRIAVHEWRRRHNGYAPWTIMAKSDRQIIGWGGLYDDPFDPGWGVEVAYFFHPSAWGLGYASEMVAACTSVADHALRLPEVIAFAHAANVGSRRVLDKAGFEVVRFVPEMDRFLYRRLGPDSVQTKRSTMSAPPTITPVGAEDAAAIADIHLQARREAMPWLRNAHTDAQTRDHFAQVVNDRPRAWWVARHLGQVVAYMLIDGDELDHLYVAPRWQGSGFGSALLTHAKTLSPRLLLWTFQRNARAREFYEARGFVGIQHTDGDNEENEPDMQYEWRAA